MGLAQYQRWFLEHRDSATGALLFSGTLGDLGIRNLQRQLVSQGTDEVSFDAPLILDNPSPFSFGQEIVIQNAGVTWFRGLVVQTPQQASAGGEWGSCRVAGPQYYLDNHEFQITWKYYAGGVLLEAGSPMILLNLTAAGAIGPIQDQIAAVIDYVIGLHPGKLAKGNILADMPPIYPPINEVRDVTCSEVIQMQLRWVHDAVTFWDYAANPPTYNVMRKVHLPAKTITLPPISEITDPMENPVPQSPVPSLVSLQLTPRHDLRRPAVVIRYEVESSVDGETRMGFAVDAWPPGSTGRELRSLNHSVSLQGSSSTSLMAELQVAQIDAFSATEATRLKWWQDRYPYLKSANIRNVTVSIATRNLPQGHSPVLTQAEINSLTSEIVGGQWLEWMEGPVPGSSIAADDILIATLNYEVLEQLPSGLPGTRVVEQIQNLQVHHKCTVTNAFAGLYRRLESFSAADPLPPFGENGLAHVVWQTLDVLQYDGAFTLEEEEPSGDIRPGIVVNLLGTKADYAAMNALVQSVSENLDLGQTHIQTGPPNHIQIDDMISLLKVTRGRRREYQADTPSTGKAKTSGEVVLGKVTSDRSGAAGLGQKVILEVSDLARKQRAVIDGNGPMMQLLDDDLPNKAVTIDLIKLPDDAAVYFRKFAVCVKVGGVDTVKEAWILASEPKDPVA